MLLMLFSGRLKKIEIIFLFSFVILETYFNIEARYMKKVSDNFTRFLLFWWLLKQNKCDTIIK